MIPTGECWAEISVTGRYPRVPQGSPGDHLLWLNGSWVSVPGQYLRDRSQRLTEAAATADNRICRVMVGRFTSQSPGRIMAALSSSAETSPYLDPSTATLYEYSLEMATWSMSPFPRGAILVDAETGRVFASDGKGAAERPALVQVQGINRTLEQIVGDGSSTFWSDDYPGVTNPVVALTREDGSIVPTTEAVIDIRGSRVSIITSSPLPRSKYLRTKVFKI